MPSPAKKRKLDGGSSAAQPRGLEYFFSRQKQLSAPALQDVGGQEAPVSQDTGGQDTPSSGGQEMTDEELARKLQAEWDQEAAAAQDATTTAEPQNAADPADERSSLRREDAKAPDGKPPDAKPPGKQPPSTARNIISLQTAAVSEDSVSESIPLDENPLTFDPGAYIPQLRDHWESDGGHASYALLTRCFVLANGTQSRIKIVDTLVNCLRILIEADPDSLLPAVWLATNSIAPAYESLELGLGGSAISKALKRACGLSGPALKAIYDRHGDAGDVAFEAKRKGASATLRRPRPLTIRGVYGSLVKIAGSQGPGSGEAKQAIVDRLLREARGGEESRYVVRTLCQHLRIGAVKMTMLIALSRAFLLARPPGADFALRPAGELRRLRKEELAEVWREPEETVKACFAQRPNYNDLVPLLLEVGVARGRRAELLARCGLALHAPLRPMLGSITRDLSEMLTRLQGRDFACEVKYDGQRAQVHYGGGGGDGDGDGRVSVFSRHLEDMTDKYPDLVALVPRIRGEGVGSFVLEGEVVAVDRETGDLRSFQALTGRARKDVAIGSITVDVCLFAFDLMYLNGQPLLDRPFRERRELLRSLFVEVPRRFTWVRSLDATSHDSDAVLDFFKQAVDMKCEGIMVKILDNLPDPAAAAAAAGETASAEAAAAEAVAAPPPERKTTKGKSTIANKKGGDDTAAAAAAQGGSRRKPLLATYEPDKRLDSWLKVKKDYSASFDTLDLVPVAGWHGQGRKARWWSPVLLACRNEETGSLEVVCKCISGFTDKFYKEVRAFYDDGSGGGGDAEQQPPEEEEGEGSDGPESGAEQTDGVEDTATSGSRAKSAVGTRNVRASKPSFVDYPGRPDVWFEPQEVWEMAFADITLSPTYTAAIGLVSEARGLSLRFPRFLRRRDDKGIDEASTSETLAAMFRKQEAKAPAPAPAGEDDQGED